MLAAMDKFERWQDFALRMARTCWTNRTRPGRDWIVNAVQDFFAGIDRDNIACFRDWDNSAPYSPSMGVLGFTAGDIRRMYPEGVPDWVKGEPEWETIGVKGVIPGVGFVPDPQGDAHSFDDIADDKPIWI